MEMNPFCPNGCETLLELTTRKTHYKCHNCGNTWKRGEVIRRKNAGNVPLTFLRFLYRNEGSD